MIQFSLMLTMIPQGYVGLLVRFGILWDRDVQNEKWSTTTTTTTQSTCKEQPQPQPQPQLD